MSITQENPRKIHKDYSLRIEVLRSDAEDDGFVLNEASEKDFWQYIRSVPFAQKAGLGTCGQWESARRLERR